jgi:DNA-binding protein H-NS
MIRKANFASMSVDELWEIHEEISKLLEAKILTEKKMLERRLISLHPAKTDKGPSSLSAGRS